MYVVINKLCIKYIGPQSGYLESVFVGWNKWEPNDWVLYNVWENWTKLLNGTYFNLTAGKIVRYSVICFVIYAFITIVISNKFNRWIMLIFCPLLLILPFAIPLCLGTFIMLGRSIEAFPIMLGVIWYLILNSVEKFKVLNRITVCFSVFLVLMQVRSYNSFVYADHIRYDLDISMARDIMVEVQQIEGYRDKPLCFTGTYHFDNAYSLEYISGCESFFNFNGGENKRILNFLNLSGYSVAYPTDEQLMTAREQATNMPAWPSEGSVVDQGDYIIVNLSRTY